MCDRAVDREVEAVGVVVGMRIAPLAFMTPFVVVVDGVVVRLSIGLRTVPHSVPGSPCYRAIVTSLAVHDARASGRRRYCSR